MKIKITAPETLLCTRVKITKGRVKLKTIQGEVKTIPYKDLIYINRDRVGKYWVMYYTHFTNNVGGTVEESKTYYEAITSIGTFYVPKERKA